MRRCYASISRRGAGDPGHAACYPACVRPTLLTVFIWLVLPPSAAAQTVYVLDNNGFETRGVLETMGPETLTIRTTDGPRQFDLATEVASVHRRGDTVLDGAVFGALIMGAVGGVVALGDHSCGPLFAARPCSAREGAAIVGTCAAFGAGIGIGIDALRRGRTQIYPSISRHAAGAVISLAW